MLDQVRNEIRVRHMAHNTEKAYVDWIRKYILFHNKRHPREMGNAEVKAFLTHLAVDRNVASSTLSYKTGTSKRFLRRNFGRK